MLDNQLIVVWLLAGEKHSDWLWGQRSICMYVCKYVCVCVYVRTYVRMYVHMYMCIYRVSHELRSLLRESVPYVKIYRYNPKHLCPKLNGYGDNGQRSLKLRQLYGYTQRYRTSIFWWLVSVLYKPSSWLCPLKTFSGRLLLEVGMRAHHLRNAWWNT